MPLQEMVPAQGAVVAVTAAAFAMLIDALTKRLGERPPVVRLCAESTQSGSHPLWKPCKCHQEHDAIIYEQDGVRIVCDLDKHPEFEGMTVDVAGEGQRLVFRPS